MICICVCHPECDVPVPGIPVPGNLSLFLMVSEPVSEKFGTEKSPGTGLEKIWYRKKSRNRYRKNLVPKKVSESVSENFSTEKSLGIGLEKIWYRKVSESGAKKFGTEKSQNQTWILLSWSRSRPVPGIFAFFLWYRNRSRKKFGTEKSPGIGLDFFWYRKKYRNRSRKKFGTEKSPGTGLGFFWYRKKSRNRSRKILVPKKSLGIGIVQILGLVTHWPHFTLICVNLPWFTFNYLNLPWFT